MGQIHTKSKVKHNKVRTDETIVNLKEVRHKRRLPQHHTLSKSRVSAQISGLMWDIPRESSITRRVYSQTRVQNLRSLRLFNTSSGGSPANSPSVDGEDSEDDFEEEQEEGQKEARTERDRVEARGSPRW
jgi:hypothetical protein